MTEFTSKGRKLTHVKSGWCVREVAYPRPSFRVFYGILQPGADHPKVIHAYEEHGQFVELPDFASAVQWIESRGPVKKRGRRPPTQFSDVDYHLKRQSKITPKQAEAYEFIIRHVAEKGFQPSMTEVGVAFGVTRRSISDRLHQLATKGYVILPELSQERCIRLNHVRFAARFAHKPALYGVLRKLFDWTIGFVEENGFQPSTTEAGEHFGVFRTTVSDWFREMVASGHVELPGKYKDRCLTLVGVRFTPKFQKTI